MDMNKPEKKTEHVSRNSDELKIWAENPDKSVKRNVFTWHNQRNTVYKTKPFATEDQQDKNVDAADPPAKEDDRSFNGSKSKNNRLFPSHDTLSDYDGEGR